MSKVITGIIVGFSFIVCSFILTSSVNKYIDTKRVVTVKGFSEREVRADLGIWPVYFKESGDQLAKLQDKIESDKKSVIAFLKENGFEAAELSESPLSIIDHYTDTYGQQPRFHYTLQTAVTVRSIKVDQVKAAISKIGDLLVKGIVVVIPQYGSVAEYLFTALNTVKSEMISEATKNARAAAEQFAKDSNASVGIIKGAQQGLFSVTDRDSSSPDYKIVRVVSTVEYFLK